MGCRRLWALVSGLPAESATWRQESWPIEAELAATQVELTDIWGRALFAALGGKPPGEPIHVQRPGETALPKRKRGLSDPDEIRRALGMTGPQAPPAAEGDTDDKEGAAEAPLGRPDQGAEGDAYAEQEPPGPQGL